MTPTTVNQLRETEYNGMSTNDYLRKVWRQLDRGEFETSIIGYNSAKKATVEKAMNKGVMIIGPTGTGKSYFLNEVQDKVKQLSDLEPRYEIKDCPGHRDANVLLIAQDACKDYSRAENKKEYLKNLVLMLNDQLCPICHNTLYDKCDVYPSGLWNKPGLVTDYGERLGEVEVVRSNYGTPRIDVEQHDARSINQQLYGISNLDKLFTSDGSAVDPELLKPGKAFELGVIHLSEIGRSNRQTLEQLMQPLSGEYGVKKIGSSSTNGQFIVDNVFIATSNSPMGNRGSVDDAVRARFTPVIWGGLPGKNLSKRIAKSKFEKAIQREVVGAGTTYTDSAIPFMREKKDYNIFVSELTFEFIGTLMESLAPKELRGDDLSISEEKYMQVLEQLHTSGRNVQSLSYFAPRELTDSTNELINYLFIPEEPEATVITPDLLIDRWGLDQRFGGKVEDAHAKVRSFIGGVDLADFDSISEAAEAQSKNIGKMRKNIANLSGEDLEELKQKIQGVEKKEVPDWALIQLAECYQRIG